MHFDDYFYTGQRLKDGDEKHSGIERRDVRKPRRLEAEQQLPSHKGYIGKSGRKTWVKFGVSPSGVWGNIKDGQSDGSNTNTDYTNYEKCFADTKKWLRKNSLII